MFCDMVEERWYSMDLLADMLIEHARELPYVAVKRVRPTLPYALARLDSARGAPRAERWRYWAGVAFGRFVHYPLAIVPELGKHDVYHVADHSYAHVLLELPSSRSGVYCHDIDAFRPWLEPTPTTSTAQRALARLGIAGLSRARLVFHSTPTVRRDLLAHGLVPEERLVHVPYGVSREFSVDPTDADAALAGRPPFILHVGTLIPRKNPEFLLRLALELCRDQPDLEFVQIGAEWDRVHREQIQSSGLGARFHQFPHKGRYELAAYYRAARAVLLPSSAEGFGLPVVEALACGAPVVTTRLPVLEEVAGPALVLCPFDDLEAWRSSVLGVLEGRAPDRALRLQTVEKYQWGLHAKRIVDAYAGLLD